MPFWVLVFARLALRERLNRLQVVGALFALGGLTWLVAPWKRRDGVLGSLLAIAAGMSGGREPYRKPSICTCRAALRRRGSAPAAA
jgi:drug/metabolite transporter (DMT)-like permease